MQILLVKMKSGLLMSLLWSLFYKINKNNLLIKKLIFVSQIKNSAKM
jgi:hypothetical protein